MSVNKERVRLWVEALRSGRFKQGHHALFRKKDDTLLSVVSQGYRPLSPDVERYCCLGVACAVALEIDGITPSGGYDVVLPWEVAQWFGFTSDVTRDPQDPDVVEGPIQTVLSTLNDSYNYDFNRIANAIERTYLGTNEGENT